MKTESNYSLRSSSQFFLSVPRVNCPTFAAPLLWNSLPLTISNGNRTEWSPIRSVIRSVSSQCVIRSVSSRVMTKSDDRAAGVRFVYHEYDYRPKWTTRSPIAN